MKNKLVNYKGTILGFASGGVLSYASWVTFLKGILNGFTADYNFYDGAILLGFICAIFVVVLVVKDMFDGGGWNRFEKKKAQMAGLVLIGLFILGFVVAKYWSAGYTLSPVVTDATASAGEFKTTSGATYYGTSQTIVADVTLTLNTPYVAVAAANDSDYLYMVLKGNQSHLTWATMNSYRGFNITLQDDGITKVIFSVQVAGVTSTLLDSSVDTDNFDLTDEGSTMEINCTWTMTDIISWKGSYVFANPADMFLVYIYFDSDYDEEASMVLNWKWRTVGSDLSYLIVVACWCGMGVIPLCMMMSVFSKAKKYAKRGKGSYRRKSYRRRR